jgi:hypothetical protein
VPTPAKQDASEVRYVALSRDVEEGRGGEGWNCSAFDVNFMVFIRKD